MKLNNPDANAIMRYADNLFADGLYGRACREYKQVIEILERENLKEISDGK